MCRLSPSGKLHYMETPRGDEDGKPGRIRFRPDWFAHHLGEGWTTDGDGIYRPVERPHSLAADAALSAARADHLDELQDALDPRSSVDRVVDKEPAPPATEHRV